MKNQETLNQIDFVIKKKNTADPMITCKVAVKEIIDRSQVESDSFYHFLNEAMKAGRREAFFVAVKMARDALAEEIASNGSDDEKRVIAPIRTNADAPAFPVKNANHETDHYGLTKREYFALNAPSVPAWFIDEWLDSDGEKYFDPNGLTVTGYSTAKGISHSGWIALEKEWRYKFADEMLKER